MASRQHRRGGRVTPKGTKGGLRLSEQERRGLEDIFDRLLSGAAEIATATTSLEVEAWASTLWDVFDRQQLVGADAVKVMGGGLIAHAGRDRSPASLIVLRSLASVAPEPYRTKAARAADRLVASGAPEPTWAALPGAQQPTRAFVQLDPVDDDGITVMVGFDGPGGPDTVGVYIDFNLGRMAKDVFIVPTPIEELRDLLVTEAVAEGTEFREVALSEAAAWWTEAFDTTDGTIDPPIGDDVYRLRALIDARLVLLPPGGNVPDAGELDDTERDELLDGFVVSSEARHLIDAGADPELVGELAFHLLNFSLDYVYGQRLRFSPVMVEIFCCSWAPRKALLDDDGLDLLPDVLRSWISFAGHRRGIPDARINEAIEAVDRYEPTLRAESGDEANWGPAKLLARSLKAEGIDITDSEAVQHFIDRVNAAGGIDVL
ncbi:MAG TPA: hypothetical protein VM143_08745 [Acidimicrobiales bacterium]|nr:hypothetical protein [Acidimicrobiales bacterium]